MVVLAFFGRDDIPLAIVDSSAAHVIFSQYEDLVSLGLYVASLPLQSCPF